MTDIAKRNKVDRETVTRHMRLAADSMVENVKAQLMTEVVPLALQVQVAALKRELQLAKDEPKKAVNTALAERILKALYIYETPEHLLPGAEDSPNEPETLAAFVLQRGQPRAIDVTPTKTSDDHSTD